MARFDAVIFDWMLTLAHYPSPSEHVEAAMTEFGRTIDAGEVGRVVKSMTRAKALPEVQAAEAIEDTSAAAHRRSEHLLYRSAGIDPVLADQMYRLLGSPDFHPPYPDVLPVLVRLSRSGLRVGVVSDIHVDLRLHAEEFGFGEFIDAWTLSFELGVQEPDPEIFRVALDQLGSRAERTLMVDDCPSRDGVAAGLGMTCLILPPPLTVTTRGLEAVLALATAP